ncbi:MAG: hypothetical protein JWP25_8943 [Bradyrhizobium sp.]|nr:hypothetical protein [Bradyrhizobium sp.]
MSAAKEIRRAMVSARAVLHTAISDTAEHLLKRERERVLRRTADRLTAAIELLDAMEKKS